MIPETQLRRRAAELGVGLTAIVRELAVLAALDLLHTMEHPWVLRGGTALAYGYFDVHRLSEDLDLTAPGEPGDIDGLVTDLCQGLSARLEAEVAPSVPALTLPGPDIRRVELAWDPTHRLQIDFSWHESTYRTPDWRRVPIPYPGLEAFDYPMWAVEEIMANKWFILDERTEPRDLFDLWFGITGSHVAWGAVVACHQDRYGFSPTLANLTRSSLSENWELRLGNQIRNLPPFEQVERELRSYIDAERVD